MTKTHLGFFLVVFPLILGGCVPHSGDVKNSEQIEANRQLAKEILSNQDLMTTLEKARTLIASGFTAGSHYGEVWIRDLATFIELSCQVYDNDKIKSNLLMFFRFQGQDGNIVDGFIPASKARGGYDYIRKPSIPEYAAHKNTVETDQESSLIQAVYKYIQQTSDASILDVDIEGSSVTERMDRALRFLLKHRFSEEYGLLWGATTSDWGDVQPEHEWGVVLDENSHYAIDIYDNAMFLIAISNYIEMIEMAERHSKDIAYWQRTHDRVHKNVRTHLWDEKEQKFIPHIYLNGSPFPDDFNENEIFYHGGTAVAIQAGLLTPEEIRISLARMIENVEESGTGTIGLTVYPPYPKGYFKNKSMAPYRYQNGGDWTWFGGRMIQALIEYGMVEEAYTQLLPMIERVKVNNGFYEWYTIDNEPSGAGKFRGSAGVLGKSIEMLIAWAEENK